MVYLNDDTLNLAVYLIYGTSFIIMFLAMTFWKNRVSHIELMNDFKFLAIFALLHGLTEYFDILRILEWQPAWFFDLMKLLLATASFAALLAFGVNVISAGIEEYRWLRGMPFGAIWMYTWMLIFIGLDFSNSNSGINYRVADLAQRYTLGLLGALISSYAFLDLSSKIKAIAGGKARRRFIYAGLAFALYAVFGGIITWDVFGVPIIVYRTISAVLITLTVIGILQLFNIRHRESAEPA